MRRLHTLLTLAGLLAVPSVGTGAVIHVPLEQPTIQLGVNAAAAGDTVIVAPGIYSESVLLYAGPMTLRSSGGPTLTIIDAHAFSQGFLVYGSVDEGTVLRGFTVQGGVAAGVTCMSGTSATIEDMALTQNQGPGILSTYASPRIDGCSFYYNNDHGVTIEGGAPVLSDCSFLEDGIDIGGGADVELKDCSFGGSGSFVRSGLRGPGARVSDSTLSADGCSFWGYDGQHALALYGTGQVTIDESEFRGNSDDLGPAIYCEGNGQSDTPLTVTNSLFEDNTSWENGGAVVLRWSKSASFTGCTFRGNSTPGLGGAVSTHDVAHISYSFCEFYENHCGDDGGAVRAYGPTACDIHIDHCLFVDNSSDDKGGSIRVQDCTGVISSCTIFGGSSSVTSGAINSSGDTAPVIEECIISNGTGYGIDASNVAAVPLILFCDVHGMSSGTYADPIPDMTGYYGNISADPLFCDTMANDFRLYELSPCATGGPGGAYIGAFDVGCSGTVVEQRSWGAIKAMYR